MRALSYLCQNWLSNDQNLANNIVHISQNHAHVVQTKGNTSLILALISSDIMGTSAEFQCSTNAKFKVINFGLLG